MSYPDIDFVGWVIVATCVVVTLAALVQSMRRGRHAGVRARDKVNRDRAAVRWNKL